MNTSKLWLLSHAAICFLLYFQFLINFTYFFIWKVQTELKKGWHRHRTDWTGSFRTTRTFLSRNRNSGKHPSPSNEKTTRQGDIKLNTKQESDSKFLNSNKKESNCESDNETGMVDTDCTEEQHPCLNNNKYDSTNSDDATHRRDDIILLS